LSAWGIFISAFLIGFSGAMMPGPMLGVTIDGSLRRGYIAGPLVVLGHGILEFFLIIIMAFGIRDFIAKPIVAGFIGLFGGAFLAWMGYGMIMSGLKQTVSLQKQVDEYSKGRNFILAGAIVSITNPYFILWWASTGMESIRQAYILGVIGVLTFFIGHILADLAWFVAIAVAFAKGKKLMNDTVYQRVILFLGIFITIFAIKFIIGGWGMLFEFRIG
jgi:threonine/homoserine/homoserine lactone efflux protein